MLFNLLLRQVASGVHARAVTRPVPRPVDGSVLRSGADEPVRVLLVGSGVTTGWGVRTHGLALAGALQQQLQDRFRHPVDVDQVSEVGTLLADAPRVLGTRATEPWDVIVLAFGLSDAIRLTPVRQWAQALDRLLAQLDGDLPRGLPIPIVVVGIPPDPLAAPGVLNPLYARHAARLNAITRQSVGRNRRVAFAPLPTMSDRGQRPEGSPEGYLSWAAAIAAPVALLLPLEAEQASSRAPIRPNGRLSAAALDAVNAGVRRRLHTLAAELRERADADLVLVNLLDHDRLWNVADSAAGRARSVPVLSTFCATTLQEDVLQVPDATADPRFADLPSTALHHLSSYAGVALRDAHGTAVGTVCVFNGASGAVVDRHVLRRAGRDVERQLAGLVSVLDGGAIFAQRAMTIEAVDTAPIDAPHLDLLPSAGTPALPMTAEADAGRAQGPAGRRTRLRVEGRQLTRTAQARSIPVGHDVRIRGPRPIRVLLVGADYAVGYGTRTRAEALDGALARVLHTRTGRGVIVENRSQQAVRLEQLAGSLGPSGAHTFDLVVWTPTFEEGARVLLRSRWVAGLGLLLRRIESTSDAAVVLVGFPSLLGSQPLAVVGRARAAQINRMLTSIAGRSRRSVLVEPPAIVLGDVQTVDGRSVYQNVAVRLLPAMMRLLTGADVVHEPAQPAEDALRLRSERLLWAARPVAEEPQPELV